MSSFYKMEPLRWDRGTDNLTLEQEAAYLRICNAIYAADQPIAENYRTLAGMWRCNERKAKRLLAELVEAGKVYVEGGWIKNERAMNDVSMRVELRVKRQSAGRSGGIESGKSRANHLKNIENTEANASTRIEEEEEEEKKSVAKATAAGGGESLSEIIWTRGLAFLTRNGVPEKQGRSLIGKWRKQSGDEAVYQALAAASKAGASEPVAFITKSLSPKRDPEEDRLANWGIADAKPFRPELTVVEGGYAEAERLRDQRPERDRDAEDDVSEMLPWAEEEARSLPVGDVQAGRGGVELLALRAQRGVLL